MSLALDPLAIKPTTSSVQPALPPDLSALLPEEEAMSLLDNLVQARWKRLACQDADPLGMLFNDRAKQWTMGWEPEQQQSLLLLIWETDSWQNKPTWSLYRNGQLVFQAIDNPSLSRRNWLAQLLESPDLPVISPTEFLSRFSDFRYAQDARQAVEQLRQTVAFHPDTLEPIKNALLALLENDLGNPEWPTLEVLKLHRVSHKNALTSLFRDWLQQGLIKNGPDIQRLQDILTQLQQDYLTLGQTIQPLFQTSYQQAYQEFRSLHTTFSWRLHLLKALPNSLPIASAKSQSVSS